MFDTMTLTKIGGGLFGAWLVLLLGKWAAEEIYHADAHGEPSYTIEVADAGGNEAAEEIDMATMMLEADVDKGAKVFKKCSACHKVTGENGTGPYLDGAYDRDIASVDGFGYSSVLAGLEGNWDLDALNGFLENPKKYAPGTTMSFPGLKKPTDRANVIAYLESIK